MNAQTSQMMQEIRHKGGRRNATFELDKRNGAIHSYSLNGHAVLVWEFPNDEGCEVYVPVVDSARITDTLTALWTRVGL